MNSDVSVVSFGNPRFIKHRLLKFTAQHDKSTDVKAKQRLRYHVVYYP